MKIYTKTGDEGTTGLLGNRRVPKDDLRIEAYGTIDELNAVLGLVRAQGLDSAADGLVAQLQDELFAVGSADASLQGKFHNAITGEHAEQLEKTIDALESELTPLAQFILPGGTVSAAGLHLARTVCRRAERLVVKLSRQPGEDVPKAMIVYLNRLSDLLFVLARVVNRRAAALATPSGKVCKMATPITEAACELSGKVVLIAGGRRVGGELALMLAARGSQIAMTYHTSLATIERTIAAVEASGARGLAVAADLSQPDQAENAVSQVVARFGRLDALVNMASLYRRTPLANLSPRDYDTLIAANLTAPYYAALASSKQMLTQPAVDGIKGKIVIIGDWATERPYKDYLPYLVAKGGLTTLTLALARELAPHIPVAMIQPAMIDPPPDFSEADKQAVLAQTPLRRFGSAGDINRLILYLLEGTNFVTGACYRVDGGRFLGEDG